MFSSSTSPARASLDDLEVPGVLVDVDGEQLSSSDEKSSLASVEVDHALDRPGRVIVETNDLGADDVEWMDSSAVQEGRPIEVRLGYGITLKPVFVGDVLGLEFAAEDDSGAALTICAYDRLHRLARARRTAAFVDKKDSQIAADIAKLHDLKGVVTDSKIVHPYVMQRQQTDLAFLRERARRIGYVLQADGDELVFVPRALDDTAVVTARFGDLLLELRVTTSLMGQVGTAEAIGWDPDAQKAIVKQATALRSPMSGKKTGIALADKLYRPEVTAVTGSAIVDDRHAEQVAAAELEAIGLRHVTCSGRLLGSPELRPGTILAVEATSKRVSGNYFITRVTHSWDPEGFHTRFEGRRTAT
jgi:phage protein D